MELFVSLTELPKIFLLALAQLGHIRYASLSEEGQKSADGSGHTLLGDTTPQ